MYILYLMIRLGGIAALCALSVGVFLLATGQPSTTSAGPPTQEPFSGSTDPVEAASTGGVPLGGALLRDVRTAAHSTFDRITFEFEGGMPGYRVEYVEPPIFADPSGLQLDIEGSAFIKVRMEPAAAHDPNTGNPTFGTRELKPRHASIVEAENAGDFEAVLNWVIGVNGRLPFRVLTFQGPDRLVIDVGHAVVATEPAGLPGTGGTPAARTPASGLALVVAAFVPPGLLGAFAFMRRRRAPEAG